MKKYVRAAESEDTRLADALSKIKEDFQFILDGMELLGNRGKESYESAIAQCILLQDSIDVSLSNVCNSLGEVK